jgi:uncharacterized protein YndB with AHSA1/START domain
MDSKENTITVETVVKAPIEKVWELWTTPEHIVKWNFATDEWCCPSATNDFRSSGSFNWRMEAKYGSMGFDFTGTYDEIETLKSMQFTLDDGRKTEILFKFDGDSSKVIETFEAKSSTSLKIQQTGWQSILNNFKNYAESISRFDSTEQLQ